MSRPDWDRLPRKQQVFILYVGAIETLGGALKHPTPDTPYITDRPWGRARTYYAPSELHAALLAELDKRQKAYDNCLARARAARDRGDKRAYKDACGLAHRYPDILRGLEYELARRFPPAQGEARDE